MLQLGGCIGPHTAATRVTIPEFMKDHFLPGVKDPNSVTVGKRLNKEIMYKKVYKILTPTNRGVQPQHSFLFHNTSRPLLTQKQASSAAILISPQAQLSSISLQWIDWVLMLWAVSFSHHFCCLKKPSASMPIHRCSASTASLVSILVSFEHHRIELYLHAIGVSLASVVPLIIPHYVCFCPSGCRQLSFVALFAVGSRVGLAVCWCNRCAFCQFALSTVTSLLTHCFQDRFCHLEFSRLNLQDHSVLQ